MSHVVVFAPGIMGSVLKLGDEVIWPGSILSMKLPYNKMAELTREDLTATDVFRNLGVFEVYSSLMDDLAACGFDEYSKPRTLYPFPYDWRKSNTLAVDGLAALLDQIRDEHGESVEISIVAHSMGGLVSRYYLESDDYKDRKGFAAVRNLITIGTPHRGAPLALTAAMGLEKRVFLSASQVLQIASDERYPALYELLPPPGEPFAWDETEASRYGPMDVYDQALATGPGGLGLVNKNLKAAAAFRRKLDFAKRPDGVRYFSFYGTREKTPVTAFLRKLGDRTRVRAVEANDAGDGTVPVWSGQPNGMQSMPVGGEHSTLFRSGDLRRTLAVLLGVPGKLAAEFVVEVSAAPKVVEPGASLGVALLFPGGVPAVQGKLSFHRVETDADGKELSAKAFGEPVSVDYSGGTVDKIGLMVDAPEYAGVYRIVFEPTTGKSGRDVLIVQEPPK